MDRAKEETTRFSPPCSRYITLYYEKVYFRYRIVSELWLNHGNYAQFSTD
jgi:hypothetical protein